MLSCSLRALAGFSAIIDRLEEFTEVVDSYASPSSSDNGAKLEAPVIELVDALVSTAASRSERLLLSLGRCHPADAQRCHDPHRQPLPLGVFCSPWPTVLLQVLRKGCRGIFSHLFH